MPEHGPSQRRTARPLVLAAFVVFWVVVPVAVLAGSGRATAPAGIEAFAPAPGESCPDTTPAPGASDLLCGDVVPPDVPGGGGLDLGFLLPILAIAAAGGVIALGAGFLVLRRRASAPFAPIDPGEWWTCRNCGKANVVGSPRCFACGTWQA